ncbi:MAG: signal peptidase I [bacterium]|nr:signal peptidase I [bacterium]
MAFLRSTKLRRFLWALVATSLVVFGVRTFVGDVYRVSSSSMEPSLFPDEWVFLRYDRSVPGRGELVVVRDGTDSFVKRLIGRPHDKVQITDVGDVLIGGAPRPIEERSEPVLVFDAERQPIEQFFERGGTKRDPWTDHGEYFELDARDVPIGNALGLMRYHPHLLDGRFDRAGNFVEGMYSVNDAALQLEFLVPEPGGRLRLVLVEQGDTFEVAIDLDDADHDGRLTAVLSRTGSSLDDDEEFDRTEFPYAFGTWARVRFENIDNFLRFVFNDEQPMLASYASNGFLARDTQEEGKSLASRVQFGGEGCLLRVRGVRIWRDLHYTRRSDGDFGIERACELSGDEIFVLGDNSPCSLDSRERGPYSVEKVLGRPTWVVWPPSAIRRL